MTDRPDRDERGEGRWAGGRGRGASIPVAAGLCASCVHARSIVSGRGSRFVLCERSRTDARFPLYPALPVTVCSGHESALPGPDQR